MSVPEPIEINRSVSSPHLALRVLLVEDNPVNLKVALLMLDRLGYRADSAGNGVQALAAMHEVAYDLVLMDVQMPEMDGLDATRRIRSEVAPDRQPTIIAMTANASKEDGSLYLLAGMDDYLPKPVRMEELEATLTQCAARRRAGTDQEAAGPYADHGGSGPASRSVIRSVGAPVYDPEPLDALIGDLGEGEEGVRRELMEAYLDDGDSRLAALGAAHRAADGKALASTAHALKSASATLGLLALASAAADIESALRTVPEDVDVVLEATLLIEEFHRATAALRDVLEVDGALDGSATDPVALVGTVGAMAPVAPVPSVVRVVPVASAPTIGAPAPAPAPVSAEVASAEGASAEVEGRGGWGKLRLHRWRAPDPISPDSEAPRPQQGAVPAPEHVFSDPVDGYEFRAPIAVDLPPLADPAEAPRLLLAEDDSVSRKVGAALLIKMGYDVDVAADGSEALAYLEHHRYAAVLMDCGMPGIDGYKATLELRRQEGTGRHTPVIALTAADTILDRERCFAAGMDDYLTKPPINITKLSGALDYWVHGRGKPADVDRSLSTTS